MGSASSEKQGACHDAALQVLLSAHSIFAGREAVWPPHAQAISLLCTLRKYWATYTVRPASASLAIAWLTTASCSAKRPQGVSQLCHCTCADMDEASGTCAWTACHSQPAVLCGLLLKFALRTVDNVQPRIIPEQLHGLVPALVASLARRPGLPPGMLASAVLQFAPILVSIADHQRQQGILNRAAPDAITSDYEAEYMVGATTKEPTKHMHASCSS